MQHWLL